MEVRDEGIEVLSQGSPNHMVKHLQNLLFLAPLTTGNYIHVETVPDSS